MKNFFNKLFFSKASVMVCTTFSALAVLLNYSFRFGYVFIDNALFNGFSLALFIIAVLNTVILTALTALKMKELSVCGKKAVRVIQFISEVFAVIFSVVVLVNFIVSGSESTSVAIKLCKEILPFWAAVVGVTAALFIVPNIKHSTVKKSVTVLMAVVTAITVYSSIFPVTPFKFTSGPVVFDNGSEYSVVFSTNDKATAYIEYEYLGETVRLYDEDNGRKNADIIHTIRVPYEQLNGNKYKVFSTRVIDELSYGGRSGKTLESSDIEFAVTAGDNFKVLTLSDWHTHNETAKQAVSYLGDYDEVILLGDSAPGMMFKEELADYILAFASDLTGGSMPVIFARGNHETRGKEAANLSSYLGIDSFYYTAKLGDYSLIVLDSGEDKNDDHSEYGGMVAYEQNRKEMVNWLTALENTDNSKTIALSHDRDICIENDLSEKAHNKLDKLNVSLLVSGHTHTTEFIDSSPYPVLVDGGINAAGKGSFVASMLNLCQDKIEIKSVDSNGETTVSETVYLR